MSLSKFPCGCLAAKGETLNILAVHAPALSSISWHHRRCAILSEPSRARNGPKTACKQLFVLCVRHLIAIAQLSGCPPRKCPDKSTQSEGSFPLMLSYSSHSQVHLLYYSCIIKVLVKKLSLYLIIYTIYPYMEPSANSEAIVPFRVSHSSAPGPHWLKDVSSTSVRLIVPRCEKLQQGQKRETIRSSIS